MSIRTARVSEEIQKVLSERLIRGLRDPLPGFVTIRAVEVTSDFTAAKIFVSVFGSDAQKKEAIALLIAQRGALRHEVGQKVRLRNTPSLSFILDESAERAARVHALLEESHQRDANLKAARDAPPKKVAVAGKATPRPSMVPAKKPATKTSPPAPEGKTPPTPTATKTKALTTTKAPAKAPAKKAPAKKAPPTSKKAPVKAPPAKKAPAKKAPPTSKKAPVKAPPANKKAPVKKAPAKPAAKKAAAKKGR